MRYRYQWLSSLELVFLIGGIKILVGQTHIQFQLQIGVLFDQLLECPASAPAEPARCRRRTGAAR